MVEPFAAGLGASVPWWACQDWAAVKAAYRFLSNPRVSKAEILAGHFEATRDRIPAGDSMVLVLLGTPEFRYRRNHRAPPGLTRGSTPPGQVFLSFAR